MCYLIHMLHDDFESIIQIDNFNNSFYIAATDKTI